MIEKIVGRTKLSEAFPLLKMISKERNLKLNKAKDFKVAKKLLIEKFKVITCII
jgi:hypothetical protein